MIHKGKAVSPNQFAQSFARSFRNAWTDLYIRRPEDKQATATSPTTRHHSRRRLDLARAPQIPLPP
jgi:hypothetical protein